MPTPCIVRNQDWNHMQRAFKTHQAHRHINQNCYLVYGDINIYFDMSLFSTWRIINNLVLKIGLCWVCYLQKIAIFDT